MTAYFHSLALWFEDKKVKFHKEKNINTVYIYVLFIYLFIYRSKVFNIITKKLYK